MASNVFGKPITDDTVRLVYPNLTQITAKHRAEVALLYMNADEKAVNVSKFVHNLKSDYGTGTSTLCMIYNATGGNLTFALNHTWNGNVWKSPYPRIIQNGQWAGFLHVRSSLSGPSKEAIVYTGKNNNGTGCDWMLAWNTPKKNSQNRVYTEIREKGHYFTDHWNYINNLMDKQTNNHSDTWNGCYSAISVGAGSSPELVGTMTLHGLDANYMAMARDVSVVSQSLDSKYVDAGDDGDDATPAAE